MSGAIKSFFNTSGLMSGASTPTLDIIQIGTPGGTTTDLIPVYQYYEYGWTAWIIDQADINKAGDIQAIEFALDGPSQTTNSLQKQRIYMGHTTMSAFPSSGVQEDLVTNYGVTNYQRVFGPGTGSTITYSVAKSQPAWNLVNLGAGTGVSQFAYNNTDNLIIQYFKVIIFRNLLQSVQKSGDFPEKGR